MLFQVKNIALLLLFLPVFRLSGAEILERRIDVDFHNIALQAALDQVAKRAGFEWSYNAGIVDGSAKINLRANDWTVREVLYTLLGNGYQFKTNGNYLILKKVSGPPSDLSGYLKDPQTGRGIAGATVYDRRTLRATTTDQDGYYQLKIKRKTEVSISRLEYRDTLLRVTPNTPYFQKIELRVDSLPTIQVQPSMRKELRMTSARIESFFRAGISQWQAWNTSDSLYRRTQVSLLPGIGTNHQMSAQVTNEWSLNILAGVSRNVQALEVGGIANFTRGNLRGVQIGGTLNLLRGNTSGVQIGGLYNETGGILTGGQIAGIVNHADVLQGAGTQIAGIVNVTDQTASGLQVAGIVNTAKQVNGVQIGGIYNHCRRLRGVQIGLVNRTDDLKGVQIGLVNRTNDLKGLQIGLVNRAGNKKRLLLNW